MAIPYLQNEDGSWNWDNIFSGISGIAGAVDAYQGGDDQVTKPYFLPGQQEGLEDAVATARGQFEQGPMSYYPDSTVAGLDPNVQAGWQEKLSQVDRLNQMASATGQASMDLLGGGDKVGGFTLPDQIGFGIPEEYQNAIMNPIMRNLNEQIIPGIHTAATSQGAFGGSRMQQQKADAATQATEAATDAMIMGNLQARGQSIGQRAGDISAQLSGRGQDINQNNQIYNQQLAGIGALGTAMNQSQFPGQVMTDVGMENTAYNQKMLDADVNRFNWNRDENINYIDRLFNRLNGTATGGTVTPAASTNWTDAVFGGLSGANIYNNVFKTPTGTTQQPTGDFVPSGATKYY